MLRRASRSSVHGDSNLRGGVWSDDRIVPERRGIQAAAPRVARAPGIALHGLRDSDQALRQHPCCLVAVAARTLSRLLGPDLQALSARRGACRAVVCGRCARGGSSATIALNVAFILLLVPIALIDAEHRIIPNRLTGLGAILALAIGTALDPSGEPARLIAGAAAGGALLIAAMAYPAAWAWATSSWPA